MARRAPSATAVAAVDAANFTLERGQPNVVTVVGLLAPGGFVDREGVPDADRLRAALAGRVSELEALCRRPVQRDREWRWVAASPELARHVRVFDRPARRGSAGASRLEAACAAAVMWPLDRERPLWELLLVPAAQGPNCGLLFRVHHAVADGLLVVDLMEALSDGGAGSRETANDVSRLGAAIDRTAAPQPSRPHRNVRTIVAETAAIFRRSVRSRVLLGPLGASRDIALFEVPLGRLHAGAASRGATVNDAFLTAFGQGIRALLADAGESLPETVPISCPVRLPREEGQGNATGVMLAPVPVAEADVMEALAQVARTTRSEKERARAAGTFEWTSGPRMASLLMRFARTQRAVGAIASDVPGPRRALRFGGAELVHAWPLSLLSANVRVGALCVSYGETLAVSIQTDAEHLPPARVVASAMEAALRAIAE
ncbi:WS/DGAT domain-containing protein [Leifsonia sp. AG29]|uniref:WS/DGAT domain-containing protein n=1 Tax=Leifsonia sp. AG29 TaxID=2598860 RepID=UPI00131B58B5|nr:WS/DGAT domain-containing protein [Leifsonia sp. AG29]